MSIIAMSGMVVEDYISEYDKESEAPATFNLAPLDGMQYLEIMRELKRDDDGNYRLTGKGLGMVIKFGLVGWGGVIDANGNPIPFNPVNIGKLPPMVLNELAGKIMDISEHKEPERKNS